MMPKWKVLGERPSKALENRKHQTSSVSIHGDYFCCLQTVFFFFSSKKAFELAFEKKEVRIDTNGEMLDNVFIIVS